MVGLIVFTAFAMAGCVFLLYFLYALWHDSRRARKGPRVKITRLPTLKRPKGKLLRLYAGEEMRERKRL